MVITQHGFYLFPRRLSNSAPWSFVGCGTAGPCKFRKEGMANEEKQGSADHLSCAGSPVLSDRFHVPTVRTVIMSFFRVEGVTEPISNWIFNGVNNYIELFQSELFVCSLINILKIWSIGGLVVMVMALVLPLSLPAACGSKSFFVR